MVVRDKTASQVEKIRAAASAGRRSALYRWMNANFDVFKATVAEAGKPNWAELAKVFAEDELWDLSGKPPSAENARLTWLQVRKTREARKAKDKVSVAAMPVATSAPTPAGTMPSHSPPPSLLDTPPQNRKPMVLRPARAIGPTELPQDDGSKLPKPLHRIR